MIDEILDNNGYFRGSSSYELVSGKNKRKAKIAYKVNAGEPYLLDSIELLPDTCHLSHAIDSLARREPYLRSGERYCTDSLQAVRTRITNSLRNRGYYYFKPEFIEYLADSLQKPGNIALRMTLAPKVPLLARQRFRTGNVTMYVFRNGGGGEADTVEMDRGTLIQMMPSKFRRNLMDECVTFGRGKVFRCVTWTARRVIWPGWAYSMRFRSRRCRIRLRLIRRLMWRYRVRLTCLWRRR